jgi:ketosteroid isomerase-like protein
MRDKEFKCTICGKFISYDELDKDEVTVVFTPDTEFTIEATEMTHEKCKWDYIKV